MPNVRVKGKRWERDVAQRLRPLFGSHVKRGYQARAGCEAPDVDGTPYWIECKHGRLVNLRAALAQALAATDGRPPVVVAKDQGRSALVVMTLADWLELVGKEIPRAVVDALKDQGEAGDSDAPTNTAAQEA